VDLQALESKITAGFSSRAQSCWQSNSHLQG
jgi:hypothetical protein